VGVGAVWGIAVAENELEFEQKVIVQKDIGEMDFRLQPDS
jgi:hypothetical protein